jgi:acetyl-CoA acetyltransferase
MNQPYIVGWGHTPFGKLDNIDFVQLIRDAALPAIESAGLTPSDIDGIFVGIPQPCGWKTPAPRAQPQSGLHSMR